MYVESKWGTINECALMHPTLSCPDVEDSKFIPNRKSPWGTVLHVLRWNSFSAGLTVRFIGRLIYHVAHRRSAFNVQIIVDWLLWYGEKMTRCSSFIMRMFQSNSTTIIDDRRREWVLIISLKTSEMLSSGDCCLTIVSTHFIRNQKRTER